MLFGNNITIKVLKSKVGAVIIVIDQAYEDY